MFANLFRSQLKRTVFSSGRRNSFSRTFIGLSTIATAATFSLINFNSQLLDSNTIKLDATITPNGVLVDKNVDPLPKEFKLAEDSVLLGYGTRAVTFLKFKVYALGIYVAKQDIGKIAEVLDSKFLSTAFIDTDKSKSHEQNVFDALHDKTKSKILISNLLDSNIRLIARISPIRNTDFNHLKDGLVKSIIASGYKDEDLQEGLQELRDAFLRKGSVPKNHILALERLNSGELQLYYINTQTSTQEKLGLVKNPIISKLLFLQYLSGGLSPDAKETSIKRISELV